MIEIEDGVPRSYSDQKMNINYQEKLQNRKHVCRRSRRGQLGSKVQIIGKGVTEDWAPGKGILKSLPHAEEGFRR